MDSEARENHSFCQQADGEALTARRTARSRIGAEGLPDPDVTGLRQEAV